METVTLLYLILAVFSALILAVFQYIFKRKEKSTLNYVLSFLRFLSLFCIFLLLINPSIINERLEIEKPNLLIAVDNSTSIKYNGLSDELLNLVDNLKSNNDLNEKFNLQFFSFGEQLKSLDSLSFSENQTSIATPLKEFAKIYKSGINPVVIATDGNQTVGSNLSYLPLKDPIYPFIVGDTSVTEDLFIKQLNINKYTSVNNQFPVEIFVNYTGDKEITKRVHIYHKGKKVNSKSVRLSNNENATSISFYLSGTEKGTQFYTAQIETLENEMNTKNNSRTFSIEVIDEKSKVLIITSTIHPDLGMFKKSIESNKQRSVVIKNINNKGYNIDDYQLVILYQPNNKFNNVVSQVLTKKINFFIVDGVHTDWSFLNKNQAILKKEIVASTENYLPVFNTNYAPFINSDIGFSSFSPLENGFGNITFSAPYQTLLYQKIGVIETEAPLLATFEVNNQKGGILFGEHSWRWRMNSYNEHQTFEVFDRFFSNLIQYLSSDFKGQRLSVVVNPLFYSNENIKFSAIYLDENLNINDSAKLWLTIVNEENGYVNKLPFSLVNNTFLVELSNLPAAEYLYKISVEDSTEKTSGKIKILPFEIEQQFNKSNNKELSKIAVKTKGTIFYTKQEALLIDTLLRDDSYKSIQKTTSIKTPLIDWKWILGIIIMLLSVEWFVRKYYGKI